MEIKFLQLSIEEIVALGVDIFYIYHPNGIIETCKLDGNKLFYLNSDSADSWEAWKDTPVATVNGYLKESFHEAKTYIKNEE